MLRWAVARAFFHLILALVLAAPAAAQRAAPQQIQPMNHLAAIAGDYFPLRSTATGTTYHIYIRHPQGYGADPAKHYPIVYLLDGDAAFPLLASHHLFLTIDDKLPEAIVVGISYGGFDPAVNKRDRDYGPGAEAFQKFLATELMPRVEESVRADATRRILVGQSYGGAFVLHSALSAPDLFWGRIASNPSFRLHGPALWEAGEQGERRDLHLYVVSGTANDPTARKQAIEWVENQSRRDPPWTVERIDIPGGTHSADIANAYRAALRKLFDWSR